MVLLCKHVAAVPHTHSHGPSTRSVRQGVIGPQATGERRLPKPEPHVFAAAVTQRADVAITVTGAELGRTLATTLFLICSLTAASRARVWSQNSIAGTHESAISRGHANFKAARENLKQARTTLAAITTNSGHFCSGDQLSHTRSNCSRLHQFCRDQPHIGQVSCVAGELHDGY